MVHDYAESAGSERAAAGLLSLRSLPTALVAADDAMTVGALRAHEPSGPGDISRCSFGGFARADPFPPRLMAIARPGGGIGVRAVRVLPDRPAGPDRPARTGHLPCAYAHRTSCGCPDGPERPPQAEKTDPSKKGTPHDRRSR